MVEFVGLWIYNIRKGIYELVVFKSLFYLEKKERDENGIKDNLVRISTGLEDTEDLKKDLYDSLKNIN